MVKEAHAQQLPDLVRLFANATSLGGVESLMDWRYRWDTQVPPTLLRLSIGLEAWEDLAADLAQAFRRLDRPPATL
jgi:cystathionine gamma-synthase